MARSAEELEHIIAVLAAAMLEDGDDTRPEDCYRFVDRGEFIYAMSLADDQQELGGVMRYCESEGWRFVDLQPELPNIEQKTAEETSDHEVAQLQDWWRRVRISLGRHGVDPLPEMADDDVRAFLSDVSSWLHTQRLLGAPIGDEHGWRIALLRNADDGRQFVTLGTDRTGAAPMRYETTEWEEARWAKFLRDNKIKGLAQHDLSDQVSVDEFMAYFQEES